MSSEHDGAPAVVVLTGAGDIPESWTAVLERIDPALTVTTPRRRGLTDRDGGVRALPLYPEQGRFERFIGRDRARHWRAAAAAAVRGATHALTGQRQHSIHMAQPDMVAEAIGTVLSSVRR